MSSGAEPAALGTAAPRRSWLLGDASQSTVLAVFGIAAIARLLAVRLIKWRPSFDDAWYFRAAQQLATGQGYRDDAGNLTAYFPAGYPLTLGAIMSAFGTSFLVAQLVNVVFSMATMLCVFLTAKRLGAEGRHALFAAVLFGFLPNQIISCCVTMSEITCTLALALAVLLAVSPVWDRTPLWGLLVGAAFGWGTLTRPQSVLVPVLLVPVMAYARGSLRPLAPLVVRLAVVMVGLFLVVGPWTYRNYRVFDTFVLVSTNGGENLLIGNNPEASGRYRASSEVYPQGLAIRTAPEIERDRIGKTLAKAYLREHPIEAALRAPKKLWYMYRSDLGVTNWIWDAYGTTKTRAYYVSQGLTQLGYLLVLGGGFAWLLLGLFRPPSSVGERLALGITVVIVGCFSAITVIFFGDARFHQPLIPFLCIAAANMGARLLHRGARDPQPI